MERSKDIGHMRTSYNKGVLAPEDVGNNPWKFFQLWFEEAQQDPHIKEANAMSICTLGTNGFPQSRIVLLKEFSPRGFIFYTNYFISS
ncbi:MAG: pyridoxamine 5'-phosphate oxidase family protein [Flavobacteriaceae bacterium]